AARAYLDGCLHTARDLPAVQVERAVLACLAELDLLEGRPRDALARLAPVTAGHPAPATEDLTYENAVQLLTALAAACLQTTDLPRARRRRGPPDGNLGPRPPRAGNPRDDRRPRRPPRPGPRRLPRRPAPRR